MKKGIIIWGGWIITVLFLMIFTANYGMQIVLAISIILPSMGILLGVLSARGIEANIKNDISKQKNLPLKYNLNVKNGGRLSCSRGTALLRLENMLTGEIEEEKIAFSIGSMQNRSFNCTKVFKHCGKVKISLEGLHSWDFMGFFAKEVKCESKSNALILPKTYPIQINIGAGNQTDLNSDDYSMYKAGFDPSETFALREYRPGDKIKNIHWKLSEKLDEITVRELGLPINNTVLVLLNSFYPVGQPKADSDIMDAVGETVVSIAQVLCDEQIPFQLAWYSKEFNGMQTRDVMNSEDLNSAMSGVLSAEPTETDQSILERFREDLGSLEYAHIIIVGSVEESEKELSSCEGIISNFVCVRGEKPAETHFSNATVTYFTPETMEEDLLYIEV